MLLRTRKTRPWGRLPQNYLTSSRRRSGESDSDHRLSRAATTERLARQRGISPIFGGQGGRLFYRVRGGGVCPRCHSRIRLSRREGRTELRGLGSEPLSRGHRNTVFIAVCCMQLQPKKPTWESRRPWGNSLGVPFGPRRGSLALLRLWARQLVDQCARELRACFLVARAPQFHRPGRVLPRPGARVLPSRDRLAETAATSSDVREVRTKVHSARGLSLKGFPALGGRPGRRDLAMLGALDHGR